MNEIREILIDDSAFNSADKFSLLSQINNIDNESDFRNLCILVAMRLNRDEWHEVTEIACSLVRKSGLFLYLRPELTSGKDALALEFHRSPSGRDSFMHRAQHQVLARLLAGESIILSAPTSFGKSYIIDELILSGKYSNMLIVVPTIALIDETRRRILRLKTKHKVVCFTNQEPGESNIFILTQERALEMQNKIYGLDLFVVDEFYKMDSSISRDDSDRASLLNVCFRLFEAKAKQVYLLGPYISKVAGYENAKHKPEIVLCNDNTTYIEYVQIKGDKNKALQQIIEKEETNIMVYCNSPSEISKVYRELSAKQDTYEQEKKNVDFANWIEENVCRDWYVSEALTLGIGIHHAQMPRFVAQEMIRRFNDGRISILLCTSTIIEGVNTAAKAVVVYSKKRGNHNIDEFTFRNIAGRAGRAFQHFSGRVYHFDTLKSTEDITVTDQIGSDNDVEGNILSLLEQTSLSDKQSHTLDEYRKDSTLPLELIKDNYFIPLENQERVVEKIRNGEFSGLSQINESHLSGLELKLVLRALHELGLNFMSIGRASNQANGIIRVSIFINAFMSGGIEELAKSVTMDKQLSDKNIEFAFDFIRNNMTYKLPRYINALNRLQKYALLSPGNLEPLATTLEYMGLPPVYVQLDELGLPTSISNKLKLPEQSLDTAITYTKSLVDLSDLDDFEKNVYLSFTSST